MSHQFVSDIEEAIANIIAYQREVDRHPYLAKRMKQAHIWYAHRSDAGDWLFAHSRFVGYRRNTAAAYVSGTQDHDGGATRNILAPWFEPVDANSRLGAELHAALRVFLAKHGHAGLRRGAKICIARGALAPRIQSQRALVIDRIAIDPKICGGRPHIRGTRVRVSDVLDMLAAGASSSEILDDFTYLVSEDITAVLAYAAAAADHRIVEAA